MSLGLIAANAAIHPILDLHVVTDLAAWLTTRPAFEQQWVAAQTDDLLLLPTPTGELGGAVCQIQLAQSPWCLGGLAQRLPAMFHWRLQLAPSLQAQERELSLGWGLGAYQFHAYKTATERAKLVVEPALLAELTPALQAIYLTRDLINLAANDCTPDELAARARCVAHAHQAQYNEIVGDELLHQNYPLIHAVGRASTAAPRLLDLRWGQSHAPKITLVGKGVCFDTGGLDIKPASGMRYMQKDMGGAAHALALAQWIMQTDLPVCLRVLLPVVENSISSNSFRPGDVLRARNGKTIEIDNTDAEGRLILADALTEAASEQPDLIIDFATLTGAARVALGTELPALFGNHHLLSQQLLAQSEQVNDPLWRLPLFAPYREMIQSKRADLVNSTNSGYAGAITAALFLQEFIPAQQPWLHLDLMAWNLRERPGRPEGGEAMGLRALYSFIAHFSSSYS